MFRVVPLGTRAVRPLEFQARHSTMWLPVESGGSTSVNRSSPESHRPSPQGIGTHDPLSRRYSIESTVAIEIESPAPERYGFRFGNAVSSASPRSVIARPAPVR